MAVDQFGQSVLDSVLMREAASWLELLHSEEFPEAAFDEWLRWLGQGEAQLRAFWSMEELWHLLDGMPAVARPAT